MGAENCRGESPRDNRERVNVIHVSQREPAVREQIMLAVPEFVICRETCRGLCPRCGTNLNESDCGCSEPQVDGRWAALKRLSE